MDKFFLNEEYLWFRLVGPALTGVSAGKNWRQVSHKAILVVRDLW